MSGLFIFLWLVSSLAFWVTLVIWVINMVKKHHGKVTGKVTIIFFILTIVFLIISALTVDTNNISNMDASKKSSSSIIKTSSNVSKTSTSSGSVKKSVSHDYSKVEYGMTMDEVINAIGTQPTDRDDYTLFYGKDEFDFNDNKFIGSSVKSVQDKIDAKFKADQKSERKQSKEQKEQKLTDAINKKINELNQATQNSNGIDVIQGIDNPYNNTYKVQLDSFVLSGNDRQIKSVIDSINSQFIEIFEDNGKQTPVMRYEVNGTEIAKNKILDPSEVKLEN